jgi:hypothetical protein
METTQYAEANRAVHLNLILGSSANTGRRSRQSRYLAGAVVKLKFEFVKLPIEDCGRNVTQLFTVSPDEMASYGSLIAFAQQFGFSGGKAAEAKLTQSVNPRATERRAA